ncbi:MAG: hypothetical protein ACRD9S_12825 [Pyrinomonadaceae bacterium]
MNNLLSLAAAVFFLAPSLAQEPTKQSPDSKYALEAILVSPPEVCSAESKKGNWVIGKEKYDVGELMCPAAESVVKQMFEKYTRVETVPEKGSTPGKVVLTFRFVDLEATRTATAFGKRKMVLLMEWTATDESGKVFWIQTVEGNAKEKTGNLFTAGKHKKKMIESIKKDLILKSAEAMRQSPEFQKLAKKAH